MFDPKFEIVQPLQDGFFMLREKGINRVIGYIHNFGGNGWRWYIDAHISTPFNNKDDTIDDLIRNYVITTMDKQALKAGVLHNEDYTKR
jgi:hypothetical protein